MNEGEGLAEEANEEVGRAEADEEVANVGARAMAANEDDDGQSIANNAEADGRHIEQEKDDVLFQGVYTGVVDIGDVE